MNTPITSGLLTADDFYQLQIPTSELHRISADEIRTHAHVTALVCVPDAEWSVDIDAMTRLSERRLHALPEIAVTLADLYNLYGRLKAETKYARALRRDVREWAGCAEPRLYTERVERAAEQARGRLDTVKRLLAVRRERQALRASGDAVYAQAAE